MDPINPSSIHSNNGDLLNSNDSNNDSPISPSLNEPILNQQTFQPLARSQNIDSNSNEHSKILPQKYQILHTNPILSLSQSQDDEIQQTQSLSQNKRNGSNSSGFLPMQSKPSVNLDNNSRLISNEVLTASDVHDEDQKYIEKLSPSNSHQPVQETKHDHDPSSPPSPTNNDNITKTNQHRSNKGNQSSNNNQNIPSNVNNNNSNNGFYQHSFHHQSQTQSVPPILPIGGIPTTPSYATPLSGPVLNEWSNRNQYLSIHQQQGHSIASQQGPPQILSRSHGLPTQHNTLIPPTQGTPLLSGQSVPIGVAGSGGSHHTGQIPSGPPSVVGSIGGISNSYRRGSSQFMDTQQHRKRTNKLKFTRSKWSDHAKRVLLNTTYVITYCYIHIILHSYTINGLRPYYYILLQFILLHSYHIPSIIMLHNYQYPLVLSIYLFWCRKTEPLNMIRTMSLHEI